MTNNNIAADDVSNYMSVMKQRKCSSMPVRYSYTDSIVDANRRFFPYTNYWHGDYEWDYPIVDERKAGYFPRTDYTKRYAKECAAYKLPRSCFETAPYTSVPCTSRYDCCGRTCLETIGSR